MSEKEKDKGKIIGKELREKLTHVLCEHSLENGFDRDIIWDMFMHGQTGIDEGDDVELVRDFRCTFEDLIEDDPDCEYAELLMKAEAEIEVKKMLVK